MRPSKLRLPESTAATVSLRLRISSSIAGGSGPDMPEQVAQPKPTTSNPSACSGSYSPADFRYLSTEREPGASEVLTQAAGRSPRAFAFCASRPAAIIARGLEVLVQLVIDAMTTAPSCSAGTVPAAGDAVTE